MLEHETKPFIGASATGPAAGVPAHDEPLVLVAAPVVAVEVMVAPPVVEEPVAPPVVEVTAALPVVLLPVVLAVLLVAEVLLTVVVFVGPLLVTLVVLLPVTGPAEEGPLGEVSSAAQPAKAPAPSAKKVARVVNVL